MYRLKEKTLEVGRERLHGSTEIMMKAEGIPPASISLQVTPNLTADPIVICLPFPARGCLAFDKDEKPLPKNLTISDLLGARAYLFGKMESLRDTSLNYVYIPVVECRLGMSGTIVREKVR